MSEQAEEPCITSIDCKILQYKYAIHKIQTFTPVLRQLQQNIGDKAKGGDKCDESGEPGGPSESDKPGKSGESNKPGDSDNSGDKPQTKGSDSNTKHLILCHYLTVLSGNVFAINEGLFSNKLELINNYKLFKLPPINISPIVSHIPYDTNDPSVTPLEKLPDVDQSIKVCKILETLHHNCLQGYEKRLLQAQQDIKNHHHIDDEKFDSLINSIFSKQSDIDLGATNYLTDFKFPIDLDALKDLVYNEASLIDIDIKMLALITTSYKKTLNHIKALINKYLKIKQQPVKYQKAYLIKQIPNWKYSLHQIFLLTLRLNDLYLILRRFIRKVYLSNFNHLNDAKFLSINNHQTNQTGHSVNYFRMLLKKVDDNFNNSKKNGVLIANLTRFIRQNSKFDTTPKNILDFINFINQGHQLLVTQLKTLQEFTGHWIQFELYFRQYHRLPVKNLELIIDKINLDDTLISDDDNAIATTNTNTNTNINTTAANANTVSTNNTDKPVVTRPSRSSSVSSNNSNNSNSSGLPPNDPFLTRRSSINKNRNSLLLPNTTSPRQHRPNSMIFMNSNQNNSTNSLPTKPQSQSLLGQHLDPQGSTLSPNQNVQTTPTGRRRSNSQPQSSPEHFHTPSSSPVGIAASGAAAALKHNTGNPGIPKLSGSNNNNNNNTNNVNTNNNSLKRLPSNSRTRSLRASNSSNASLNSGSTGTSSTSTTSKGSPISHKVQPIIEESNHISEMKKLSANQRLQNHLRQAAKSGSLMTQEREVLTSVVFDPNSPSAVNLKRYLDKEVSPPSDEILALSLDAERNGNKTASVTDRSGSNGNGSNGSGVATAPLRRKTRDQVTKLNTKRNSELIQIVSGNNSDQSSNTSSKVTGNVESELSLNLEVDSNNNIIKRVRFMGVPDYTEAEDAPTKYSNRILKNFAVFKTPSKPGFKRKDQLLKKEESLSFKSQLHQAHQHSIIPGQGQNFQLNQGAPPPLQTKAQEEAQAYLLAQQHHQHSSSPFLSNPIQNTKMKLKTRLT